MARPTHKLLAVLGVTFGLAVTIGNTIGAGILRTPGTIAAHLPTFLPFIAVWAVGGLYALLGANALAELGTMLPRSGGQYVFVRRGLGDYAGFMVGWSDWISTCGITAAVSIVIGEYSVILFPDLVAHQAIALLVVGILTMVQWFGIRSSSNAQMITSALKVLALALFIGACFWFGGRNPAAASLEAEPEGSLLLAFVLALQAVIYTYSGWSAVIYFSEEVKDPARNIPRSIFGGVALVIAIYLLINIAFLRVVPLGTIAGEKLAAAAIAQALFGLHANTIVRVLTIVALLSAANSNILMAPRVLYAMASDGLFWRGAREVNVGGTHDVALMISSMVAAALIVTGTFESVVGKLAFFFVANYTLSFISLFVLRRREPAAARPFRAIGHPVTTGLAVLASLAFLIGAVASDAANSIWTLALLCLSIPTYLVLRSHQTDELSI
ncbi:MAG: APC family permease [Thermoanaerobaculia bacterium]